jgi:hypothetical protein
VLNILIEGAWKTERKRERHTRKESKKLKKKCLPAAHGRRNVPDIGLRGTHFSIVIWIIMHNKSGLTLYSF